MSRRKIILALIFLNASVALLCGCLPGISVLPTTTESTLIPSTQLTQYMLDLINQDRADKNINPVTLGANSAAQSHADDMLTNFYLSHWDSDGLKPYMRYKFAGGINYEEENSAYSGWYDASQNPNQYATIDPEETLKQLEYDMMYDDASSNWGHRDAILNPLSKKVNIGIAYDKHRLTLVQQFEGDYVTFTQSPAIVNNKLYLAGTINLGEFYSLHIFYDPIPQPLTQLQLLEKPHSYDLGEDIGYVLPPKHYMENDKYVTGAKWNVNADGSFDIEADITPLLKYQTGVYNVSIVSSVDGKLTTLSNYSIFLK